MAVYNVFVGTFIHLPRTGDGKHALEIQHGALWVSTASGHIEGCDWTIGSDADVRLLLQRNGWTEDMVHITKAREEENEFFFPGFIDTHIHAPQYPNIGLFGSSTLLDWLETYTFPLEASFSDTARAAHIYRRVITRTLANGTTCAAYFATIHVPATNLLATLCHRHGQRALIGRVCMDNAAFCPGSYRDESAPESVRRTAEVVAHIASLDSLVEPIITPRFAPTCTPQAMEGLAALAASHTPPLRIQTHIAENPREIALVGQLFPNRRSYADVYDAAGLLTPRTILAHAVHLTPDERALIAARRAKVAHCPASNSALASGLCPVRELLRAGISVGLGTDVSGGYSVSILEAVRQACLVSRLVGGDGEVLSVEDGLYLATRGGAVVVDLADEIGGFDVGMSWDAQLVRLGRSGHGNGNVDVFGWESWVEKVHKWVWTGDDRNVHAVWVRGRLVHDSTEMALD